MEPLQEFFIKVFLRAQDFAMACNAMLNNGMAEGSIGEDAETLVGKWIEDSPEFKVEFDRAKKVISRVRAEKAEDFLHKVGSGKQKTGKDSGISTANVVAAHMVLEAEDKAKWSSKVEVKKTETRNITTIIKHYGSETKVETIDLPEVKELPSGNSD
jgi:hypothetical protein